MLPVEIMMELWWGQFNDRFNDANSSYDFDTNDLVLVHNTANFPHGNSTRTISVWIKPLAAGATDNQTIFIYGNRQPGKGLAFT